MTKLSVARSLSSCTPHNWKSEKRMENTDVVTCVLAKDMLPIQLEEKKDFN